MKSRHMWKKIAGTLAAACLLFSGCSSSGGATKVTVAMNASGVNLLVNQTFQFSAQGSGATDTTLTFSLSYVPAATPTAAPTACVVPPTPTTNPNCGTLGAVTSTSTTVGTTTTTTFSVTYTAPATVPNPAVNITLTATSNADKTATATATISLDSGIRVSVTPATATIGTGETFNFIASVTNDPSNSGVTWSITQGGTVSTVAGIITLIGQFTGQYTAPPTVPATATATIVATAVKDPSRTASATVTIVTAAPITFTGISPATAPQGAIFQDIYLNATNLRSTSSVQFGITSILAPQLKIISANLARLRLNATNLQSAAGGPFRITITGATEIGGPFTVTVLPTRPALIGVSPDTFLQSPTSSPSVILNGGFYGPSNSPIVSAQFNGGPRPVPSPNITARQLQISLNPGDLNTPGLFPVSVQNSGAPQPMAATNLAVQPVNAPTLQSLLPLGNGTAPSAIAVDTAIGTAIVANTGNGTAQLLNLNGATPALLGGQITLLGTPTGVAVDEERHIAAVAVSNGGTVRNVTIVGLPAGNLLGTIDLTAMTAAGAAPLLPFAVGLDSSSGRGIVAFSSTNIGAIFNTDPTATPAPVCLLGTAPPYCVTGVVTLNTGASPQIAFQPRLRWVFVTPGGAGLMSVVDLGAAQHQAAIVAGTGVGCSNSVVTIKTAAPHGLDPSNLGPVLISGVPAPGFNGSSTVSSVVDPNTFTFSLTVACPSASSGGGTVNFSNPLLSFSISPSVRGIAINPLTERAVLADPNASSTSASILSTLDQTNFPLNLGHPVSGAAFQPFTNVAVVVKPGTIGATAVDTITLLDPTGTAQITGLPLGVLAEIPTGGTGSGAVAVDPATNLALVANAGSNNISVISLGTMHTPQISQVVIPPPAPPAQRLFPQGTLTSATALPVQIFGAGFAGTPQVRLDGVPISGATIRPGTGGRIIDVTIPASSSEKFLTSPRRYALDVAISPNFSNVTV